MLIYVTVIIKHYYFIITLLMIKYFINASFQLIVINPHDATYCPNRKKKSHQRDSRAVLLPIRNLIALSSITAPLGAHR